MRKTRTPCPAVGQTHSFRQGGRPVEGWGSSLMSRHLLSLQLFAMIFAMCLFRGIQ